MNYEQVLKDGRKFGRLKRNVPEPQKMIKFLFFSGKHPKPNRRYEAQKKIKNKIKNEIQSLQATRCDVCGFTSLQMR